MKLNAKGRSSDLLPVFCLPVTDTETVTYRLKNVIELTAAGQLQIYTVFPFNSGCNAGNQKQRKCSKKSIEQSVKNMD